MNILIVGGGVAGLALAGFLKNKKDVRVTLIERAPEFHTIGYAIALWGNGRQIIERLGAEHDIAKDSYEVPWDAFESIKSHKLLQAFYFKVFYNIGPTVILPRYALHNALIKQIGSTSIKFNTTPTAIIQNGEQVEVAFSDGTKDLYDLVVGADGINSEVRKLVFGEGLTHYYNWSAWAFWIPETFSHDRGETGFVSDGKVCLINPWNEKSVALLLSADAPGNIEPVEQRKEALKKKFAEFGKPLSDMIESIENPKDIFRDDLRWVDLKDWYKNRVVLLGDAKHAISPMMGMGASLALEDAYVLFDELSKISSPKAIDSALNNFAIRRDRRLKFIRKSAKRIEGWIMAKGFKAWIRELVGPFIPTSIFINDLKKIVNEKI